MSPRVFELALARYTAHRIRLGLQSLGGDLLSTAQAIALPQLVLVWLFCVAAGQMMGQCPVSIFLFQCLGTVKQVGHYFLANRLETVPATAACTF